MTQCVYFKQCVCKIHLYNMLCWKRSSVKVNNLLPYEYRLYLINAISEAVNERRISDAKKKLKELKKTMAVELTPRNGQALQLPHMMEGNVYVVERHAHKQIHKLEDALSENKLDLVKNNCRILRQMFGIPRNDEILHQIDHENTINLKMIKKTHRVNLRLYNCDLPQAENLKMCHRILKGCHELKKVQLEYCKIDDRTMAILLKPLATHPQLLYLGLKGNNLSTETIVRLQELLEDRENFKQLLWIDMTINNGVTTIPRPLIEALVERWPSWVRKNVPSKDVKLSALDIIQGRMPKMLTHHR